MTAHSQPRRASALGSDPATSARPPVFAKGTTSEAANNSFGALAVAILESGTRSWPGSGPGVHRVPNTWREQVGSSFCTRGARNWQSLLRPVNPSATPGEGGTFLLLS